MQIKSKGFFQQKLASKARSVPRSIANIESQDEDSHLDVSEIPEDRPLTEVADDYSELDSSQYSDYDLLSNKVKDFNAAGP